MNEIWDGGKLNFSMFAHVRRFLQGDGAFTADSYTQSEVISAFDLDNNYHIQKQLVDYNDGSKDFYEKVYIWNTGRFILHDNVRFIVEPDGSRRIENLAVVTFNSENFDFDTTDANGWAGQKGNAFFKDWIDPQGIGQTVAINFNHDITDFEQQYTLTDLNADIQNTPQVSWLEHKANLAAYTKYGLIEGDVITISDDAILGEQKGLVYKAKVALKKSDLSVNHRKVDLIPGMSMTAEVKTDERRIIEFFLEPLMSSGNESLRDR